MEQTTIGIQQKISFVVLLLHRRVSYDLNGRKAEILLGHSFCKQEAFFCIHAIGSHIDKLDALRSNAENIIRHLQVYTPGHRLQQRIKTDGRSVDIRRYAAEIEILRLHDLRSDRYPVNRIRKTFVGHQLAEIKHRQNTVESRFGIDVSGSVATYGSFSLFLSHQGEIADHETI